MHLSDTIALEVVKGRTMILFVRQLETSRPRFHCKRNEIEAVSDLASASEWFRNVEDVCNQNRIWDFDVGDVAHIIKNAGVQLHY